MRIFWILLILVISVLVSFLIVFSIEIISKKKFRTKNKVIFTSLITIVLLISAFMTYLLSYNPARQEVKEYLKSDENVNVKKIDKGYYFDGKGNDVIIFYPGAKVEYIAYAPLMHKLASNGVDTVLVQMPFNIAFFGKNKANEIIDKYKFDSVYLMGHSLGGVLASSIKNDKVNGMIFLASYPNTDVSVRALSIYGSNDNVLKKDKYEEAKKYIKDLKEYVIEGGNHTQFANYDLQSGDNKATISYDEQQDLTVNYILEFIL